MVSLLIISRIQLHHNMKRQALIDSLLLIFIILSSQRSGGQLMNKDIDSFRLKYQNTDIKVDLAVDLWSSLLPLDFDGDGDLDLICGEFVDRFTWFENTGTPKNPVFAAGKFLENSAGLIHMDLEMMMPVAIDWNGDKFVDLIVGDEDGRIALIENTGLVKTGCRFLNLRSILNRKLA